jgi:predicted Rossmann fold nucleotide-binding protein DprA/Smf involved in DNA uptake
LAACLKQKIMALPAKVKSDELSFPHRFVHFHAQVTESAANLPPELRFYQLEQVRSQRAADAAIAFGTRANAAEAYDAVVTEYKKDPKKNWGLVPKLKESCAALVKAADTWVSALEAQQAVDQATLTLVTELKAKDEGWATVETASQGTLANTQKDLETAKQRRQADEAACPKERGK